MEQIGLEMARQEIGKRSIAIEYIRDELTMSLAYSAADLFVVPSMQDNLPIPLSKLLPAVFRRWPLPSVG
jgi:hypothetical protein